MPPSRRRFLEASVGLAGLGTAHASPPRDAFDPAFEPAYLKLHRTGALRRRADKLWALLESCRLCPRECGAGRQRDEEGFCRASRDVEVSSYHPHFGEERPLSGRGGSGTIFLTHCSLRCVFCINWEVSQGGQGWRRRIEELTEMMLDLQRRGGHNVNVVTPTHYSPHLVRALDDAAGRGLRLPVVYNTCGWERLEVLKLLDGVVDIYLPDFKYRDGKKAAKYSSGAETYPEVTREAILEMHRQVGVAHPAPDGLVHRGLMIRHLVMPSDVGSTKEILAWIAESLPKDTYVNVMSQYRPSFRAFDFPEIARPVARAEYEEAVAFARGLGLTNLDIQGWRS